MRFSINHWTESQNTLVVALIMSVTDCVTLDTPLHFSVRVSPLALDMWVPCCTTSPKATPVNLLENAVQAVMAGMYSSQFSNTCHVLNTNSPPENPKMTSVTLRSSYPVLSTNSKSTTLLLESNWDGIQPKATCRSGPGQLLSMVGSKPSTQDAVPLPPLTLTGHPEIPSPAWGVMGQSATFLPVLYPLKEKNPTVQGNSV